MASRDLGKELLQIHAQIFNHHAVLNGESKYFIKEFESRRNNRELSRLNEITSNASRIEHNVTECADLSSRIESLQEKVSKATITANDILNKDNNDDEIRKENKMKRDADWDVFIKEMETAKQDVERRHRERVNELKLEKKQMGSPGTTP